MLQLALAFSAAAGAPVVFFVAILAAACALTKSGHCVGVIGSPNMVAAERIYRSVIATLLHQWAERCFPKTRSCLLLLGTVVANSLMTPGRGGENGFQASAVEQRFRVVEDPSGGPPITLLRRLRTGTPVVYVQELVALHWERIFQNVKGMTNGAKLLQTALQRIAAHSFQASAAEDVENALQHYVVAARLGTPAKALAVLEAFAEERERKVGARLAHSLLRVAEGEHALVEALNELASRDGVVGHVGSNRRVSVKLGKGRRAVVAQVALPIVRNGDLRLRLLPGERVLLHMDVGRRLLLISRAPQPDALAMLLLAAQPLDPHHQVLLRAVSDARLSGAEFPAAPTELPCWVGLGLSKHPDAVDAVAAAEMADAATNAADAASVLARGEVFSQRNVPLLAAAVALWRAVAANIAERQDRNEENSAFLSTHAQDASRALLAAETALAAAHCDELAHAAESAAFARVATAAGVEDVIFSLPPPPLQKLADFDAAVLPPPFLLKHLGVKDAPPYAFSSRPSLTQGNGMLSTNGFSCMSVTSQMRLEVIIPALFGGSNLSLAIVPACDFVEAGVAASVVFIACGKAQAPVTSRVLRYLLGDAAVDAARDVPAPSVPELLAADTPLRTAACDAVRSIFHFARMCFASRRDPDAFELWSCKLGEWLADFRRLVSVTADGSLIPMEAVPARNVSSRRSKTGFRFVVLGPRSDTGSVTYHVGVKQTLGVGALTSAAPSAYLAARAADICQIMTEHRRTIENELNFNRREYTDDALMPVMPRAIARRGEKHDTPELEEVRCLMRMQLPIVAALVAARFRADPRDSSIAVDSMPVSVAGALLVHANLVADELRVAANVAAATISPASAAELGRWAIGAGGTGAGEEEDDGEDVAEEPPAKRPRVSGADAAAASTSSSIVRFRVEESKRKGLEAGSGERVAMDSG